MEKILDRIIDQANRYDGKNLQYEQDILFNISREVSKLIAKCVSRAVSINKLLDMETLIMRLTKDFTMFESNIRNILFDVAKNYSDTAYKNTGDLIDMYYEIFGRYNEKVNEQKVKYDDDTIAYIQKYAFDLLTGYSQDKLRKLRADLGYMLLTGNGSKSNIRNLIENTLNVNKSKAEEIAQQELSMAYNAGVMRRLNAYSMTSGNIVKKYWHGFKYSDVTCNYCRDRIGNIYDIDDDSETLPTHVRCRCVWLPVLEGWDKPVTNRLLAKANMLNTGYSIDMMYQRINTRLGIKYAEYMTDDAVVDYMSGDRSTKVADAMKKARNNYITDLKRSWNIQSDTTNSRYSSEYNQQMKFWKDFIASAIADGDTDVIVSSREAIKGIMTLPWTSNQLDGWNKLLSKIM